MYGTPCPLQIRRIFQNTGVQMSDETFQQVWEVAAQDNPDGQCSVESFRSVLDACQALDIQQRKVA